MPRSTPERVLAIRSIREHLLNVQERRGSASTPTGAKKELFAAVAELTIFVNSEYPEEGD